MGFERELEMTILYDEVNIGTRRVDFYVKRTILVELKALKTLGDVHLAQAMSYCQAFNQPVGLLINFGSKSLEFKRVYNVNHPDNRIWQQANPKINQSYKS